MKSLAVLVIAATAFLPAMTMAAPISKTSVGVGMSGAGTFDMVVSSQPLIERTAIGDAGVQGTLPAWPPEGLEVSSALTATPGISLGKPDCSAASPRVSAACH